jgi:hypothetical protein
MATALTDVIVKQKNSKLIVVFMIYVQGHATCCCLVGKFKLRSMIMVHIIILHNLWRLIIMSWGLKKSNLGSYLVLVPD